MGDNEWLGYPDKVDGETRLLKVAVVSATHLASKGFFGGADPYIKIRLTQIVEPVLEIYFENGT